MLKFVKDYEVNGKTISILEETTEEYKKVVKEFEEKQIYTQIDYSNGDSETIINFELKNGYNDILNIELDLSKYFDEYIIGQKIKVNNEDKIKDITNFTLLEDDNFKVIGRKKEEKFIEMDSQIEKSIITEEIENEEYEYKIIRVIESENYIKNTLKIHYKKEKYNEIHNYVIYENGRQEYKCYQSGFLKKMAVKENNKITLQKIMDKEVIEEKIYDKNGNRINMPMKEEKKSFAKELFESKKNNNVADKISKDFIREKFENLIPKYKELNIEIPEKIINNEK